VLSNKDAFFITREDCHAFSTYKKFISAGDKQQRQTVDLEKPTSISPFLHLSVAVSNSFRIMKVVQLISA